MHVVKIPAYNSYFAVVKLNSEETQNMCKQKVIDLHIDNVTASATYNVKFNGGSDKDLMS